jgi:hypothetical protein
VPALAPYFRAAPAPAESIHIQTQEAMAPAPTLRAQYPNGGWPQYYPLRTSDSRHITFNDDAMVRVMTMLDEICSGRDGVIKRRLADIDVERRTGDSWLGPHARTRLAEEYPAWIARIRPRGRAV